MFGDDLTKSIEKNINKLIRDLHNGKITKSKASILYFEYNKILKSPIFNGNKRKIKQELMKFKSFLR